MPSSRPAPAGRAEFFTTMRVLVTGGSGFIGTNLVEYYLGRRQEVINFDIAPPRNPLHQAYWRNVDIRHRDRLASQMAEFHPSHIVNLAAQTGTSDRGRKLEDYATNTEGVQNVIAAARACPSLERVIFTSSMIVCRIDYRPANDNDYCPDTLYGESKMLGEKLVREAADLPYSWLIVRPTGIWGPWFDVPYRSLFRMIEKGLYVHPRGVDVHQSLGFVGNSVCQLDRLLQAPQQNVHGRTFYLADDPPLNMRAWTSLVQQAFGAREIREAPLWLLRAAARAGDALKVLGWEVPPLSTSRLNNMLTGFLLDLDPLIIENPRYSLEEAVAITADWLNKT